MLRSIVLSALALGCAGEIETFFNPTTSPDRVAEEPTSNEAFDLATEQPQLLPFNVRLARLAAVVGVPATDPIFDAVRKNRTSLGDHDFANGQQPDRLWSASRMSLWVRSLKPVCASKAMRDAYPALPGSLPLLVENAFGRSINDEDRASVAVADELAEDVRYQTICLAILSSAEFVVQ